MVERLVIGAVLAVALGSSGAAEGAPRSYAVGRLLVSGSEPSCPRAADLASSVNRLLGRSAIVDEGEELRVYWRVEPVEHGTLSVFRLVDSEGAVLGTRAVRSDHRDCEARLDADALTLALMLDLPPEQLPAPRARTRGPELALALGSTAAVGWFPQPRLGLDSALSMAWTRRFRPGLGFGWWPATEFTAAPGRYQMSAWLLSLTGSLALWESPIGRAGLRAGLRAGAVAASGVQLPRNSSSSRAVADVTLAAEASVHLAGPLWLTASGGAATPLRGPEVVFLDAGGRVVTAHRAGNVSGFATIAAVVHFLP
jgi:hypothetical protein